MKLIFKRPIQSVECACDILYVCIGPGENCGYIVKRLKDLPKLHKAVWKDDLQRVKTVLTTLKKTMYMDYFDKEHR